MAAGPAIVPIEPRIAHDVDNAMSNIDNASAVSKSVFKSYLLSSPRITPATPMTSVNAEIPTKADLLTDEIVLSILVVAAKLNNTPDNVAAFVDDALRSYLLSNPRITPIAPMTTVKTAIVLTASVLTFSTLLMIANAVAIDNSITDNATDDEIVASIGKLANI